MPIAKPWESRDFAGAWGSNYLKSAGFIVIFQRFNLGTHSPSQIRIGSPHRQVTDKQAVYSVPKEKASNFLDKARVVFFGRVGELNSWLKIMLEQENHRLQLLEKIVFLFFSFFFAVDTDNCQRSWVVCLLFYWFQCRGFSPDIFGSGHASIQVALDHHRKSASFATRAMSFYSVFKLCI